MTLLTVSLTRPRLLLVSSYWLILCMAKHFAYIIFTKLEVFAKLLYSYPTLFGFAFFLPYFSDHFLRILCRPAGDRLYFFAVHQQWVLAHSCNHLK